MGATSSDLKVIDSIEKKIDEQWPLFDTEGSGALGKDQIKEIILKIKSPLQEFDEDIFSDTFDSYEKVQDGTIIKEDL